MGRKHGSTLIQTLFAFCVTGLVIQGISIIFMQLSKLEVTNFSDISYCLYSLSLDISLANNVEVDDDQVILYQDSDIEFIYLDENRVVKSPGFNIYLHNVDDLHFSYDDLYVYLTLTRGDYIEKFKIGVYYRPTFRVCESNSDCDITDTSNDESIDHLFSE